MRVVGTRNLGVKGSMLAGNVLPLHTGRRQCGGTKFSSVTSLKLLCRLAEVKYRGFHGFRRTRASYAALKGGTAAATEVLDHSDPKLQERYVDPDICPRLQSGVDCLPPLDLSR